MLNHQKKNIYDLIEAHYLLTILKHLYKKGFFKNPDRPKRIAQYFGNRWLFDLVRKQTDLIGRVNATHCYVSGDYHTYLNSGFLIDKFIDGFNVLEPGGELPLLSVNAERFGQAFEKASAYQNNTIQLSLLKQLGARHLLDLGCGKGKLLYEFCNASANHEGTGIDQNDHLLKAARQQFKSASLKKRITFYKGDVSRVSTYLTKEQIKSVDVIYGASILNEFCEQEETLKRFLIHLRSLFKGKYLIVLDYYGVLNTAKANQRSLQPAYIHDIMQLLSGQGVPFRNRQQWFSIYKQAGCTPVFHFEPEAGKGNNWFIHVVKLGA
ncbi:MAG: methyltransferase domain-containing protein [Sediminibacterium sp.]|nr:methyltransferase domain-containing protein [Sediminibacterium sp.]